METSPQFQSLTAMIRLILLAGLLVPGPKGLSLAVPTPDAAKTCGYSSCPAVKDGMLNVHLVPHTHDDVGWLKTIDQYFYGSKNEIQKAGVQYIIDSVISELSKDPSRRFIYVETAFFWQWWVEQDDDMKAEVLDLVNSGRLEFIGGAWSMHDEAAAHYHSIVDQFSWGHRKLNDTFGECGRPRIGWQIDPFGHARETASMFAHMGFDGMFFARLDYQDFDQRKATNTTEMFWQASANQGDASSIFASILYYFYMAPPNFCFDIECNDEPIIDNPTSPDYNVGRRIDEFIDRIRQQAQYYKSGHLIMAMGGDFNYQQADTWYKNMDKLIKYINERQETEGINVLYSTPSCYLKALNDAGLTWSTKTDDFFPYSSDPHAFWTGYYTSRPTSKYFERKGNNLLQVCKQLSALASLGETTQLETLRSVMGVMQHHDAITGTEKQHVADDYALRLHQAFEDCLEVVDQAVNQLVAVDEATPAVNFSSCLLSNISQCDVSESNDRFVVTLYNPMGQEAFHYVRLPIPDDTSTYTVHGPGGEVVTSQVVPIPAPVLTIPGRTSTATHELVFRASALPPLGLKSFYIQRTPAKKRSHSTSTHPQPNRFTIGDEKLRVKLDPETGLLESLNVQGRDVSLTQNFYYYVGTLGNNEEFEKRASGAYIFRPTTEIPTVVSVQPEVNTFVGAVVDEFHQVFDTWVSQVVRKYHGEDYVEFDWLVGPIPTTNDVDGAHGREVITRFTVTDWATDGIFYTDSNGREMIERKRNFRPTWNLNLSEPVAGNYYPITSAIALRDPATSDQFTVLVDRAQGGSSLNDGEIEVMLHRRCLKDDAFGVNEALNEVAFNQPLVARGRHIVSYGVRNSTFSPSGSARQRQLSLSQMVAAPWVLLTPTDLTWAQWEQNYVTQWSGLNGSLPENVHLLTLEPWHGPELLLRLEHFLETQDDPLLSQDAAVVLEDLFNNVVVSSAFETTLSGNQWLYESSRLEWQAEGSDPSSTGAQQLRRPNQEAPTAANRLLVELTPMQIRTFVLNSPLKAGAPSLTASALILVVTFLVSLTS